MRTRGIIDRRKGVLFIEADAAGLPPDYWAGRYFRDWDDEFKYYHRRTSSSNYRAAWVQIDADDLRFMQRWHQRPNESGLPCYELAAVQGLADFTDYSTGAPL